MTSDINFLTLTINDPKGKNLTTIVSLHPIAYYLKKNETKLRYHFAGFYNGNH